MRNEKHTYQYLDNLLSGLEEGILDLDDQQIDVESIQFFGSIRDVRDVIATSLQPFEFIDVLDEDHITDRTHGQSKRSQSKIPAIPVPNSLNERKRLLAQLLRHRSSIPSELRMAFSARKALSDSETEEMVERLIRLGILCREHANDDDS